MENRIVWAKGMAPDNRRITMEHVIMIEEMCKQRIPLPEIARRMRLPYWQIEQICKDGRIAYRP